MQLDIRPATVSDASSISALVVGLASHFLVDPDSVATEGVQFMQYITPEAIASYLADGAFRYLVGEVDGELAAVVATRDDCHLYHLFVRIDFQGRGFASLMWREALARAVAGGNEGWFTVNSSPNAIGVYEHLGFRATDELQRRDGVAFLPMRMELEG